MPQRCHHHRAKDAAHAMHGENIKRIVDRQPVADQIDRFLTKYPGHATDEERLQRSDIARRRGDRGETGDGTGDEADHRGAAEFDPLPGHPAQRGGGGREMRHRDRHRRLSVRSQLRAAVETKPAHPEHARANRRQAGAVRRCRAVAARAQHHRQQQRRKARGFMHHNAAREIPGADGAKDPAIRHHAAAPDPMRHRRIDHEHPERREQHDKAKADPLGIGAHDQRRGDDRKGHLEGEEQNLGQGAMQALGGDAAQSGLGQASPERPRLTKGDGIADQQPKHRDQRRDAKDLHENREHIARPHQAAVK